MTDNLTPKDRRKAMQSVRNKGTSIERKLWATLAGLRIKGWHKNARKILGNPDVIFTEKRIVIFVDGCFWHGHNCRNVTPSDNAEYWRKKIEKNKSRDKVVTDKLTQEGWQVIRFWECEIKKGNAQKLLAAGLFSGKESGTTKNA